MDREETRSSGPLVILNIIGGGAGPANRAGIILDDGGSVFGLEIVVCLNAVLHDIHTEQLVFLGNPQANGFVNGFEKDKSGAKGPDKSYSDANQLGGDDTNGYTLHVEESSGQSAPGTADSVN